MEKIYSKIKLAEEHLQNLRTNLEAAEKSYKIHGKHTDYHSHLSAVTLPFLESACASAKAAVLSSALKVP
jgi:hypothetical protein